MFKLISRILSTFSDIGFVIILLLYNTVVTVILYSLQICGNAKNIYLFAADLVYDVNYKYCSCQRFSEENYSKIYYRSTLLELLSLQIAV